MTWTALRRILGLGALLLAAFAFVQMLQVGDEVAVLFRVPYSGQTIADVPLRIEKDGFYLVQLEVSEKAKGEDIQAPTTTPLRPFVESNGKEIGSASDSQWYLEDEACFGYYGFPATTGQHVQLSVKPSGTLRTYKSHVLHLIVQRDISDYGLFMWRHVGWFLLILLFLIVASGLLLRDLKTLCRNLLPSWKLQP